MSLLALYLALFALYAAQADTLAPGLVAAYRDAAHTVREVVATPNFYLAAGESAHPSIAPEFEAEWAGLLSVIETGHYAFECACDVEIDGRSARGTPVRLVAGKHPIHLRYRRRPGPAKVRLQWMSAKFPLEPVPSANFEHRASDGLGPDELRVKRGRELVEELGCVQCHSADSRSLLRRRGPNLTGIGARTNERWLFAWLSDPAAFRPDATMPVMLDEAGRRDVARYLASLTGSRFQARPTTEIDVDRGRQLFGAIGCAACHRKGRVQLDGLGSKSGAGALAAYLKDPSRFDPGGRMPSMLLTDEEAIQLAAFLAGSRNPAFEKSWDGGDATRGKALVRSAGCLACHTLEDTSPAAGELTAPRLEALTPGRGCLAPEARGVPRYRLSVEDRSALEAFLRSYAARPDRASAPVFTLRRELGLLGCIECHQLDHQLPTGSPAEAAPSLTDTGAKLRTRWIAEVLSNRQRVQGYLELRMPHYDSRVTGALPETFAKASGVEPGDGTPPPAVTGADRARGVELLGMNVKKGGMACAGCHDLGDYKSQGENGPQLANSAERFRYEWFLRWMRDPVRILSGTSMPAYFRNKPAEEADRVIRTLWAALAMGGNMPLPEGLKAPGGVLGGEEKPVPVSEPIVIRWDMPGATPAAIAIGMPGKISYCFDAGEARLRYAWAGGFVDMSGTLYRKTDASRLTPTAQLVGEVFYRAEEFPWRIGTPDRIPSRRFRGYRLVDGFPEFHYLVDDIDVYERILPVKERNGIVRKLRIGRVEGPTWFVVGEQEGLSIRSSLGAPAEGRLPVPRGRDVRFDVTIVKGEKR